MFRTRFWAMRIALLFLCCVYFAACRHTPLLPDDPNINPTDTTTNPIDTSAIVINDPCHSDSIYFANTVLPLLLSNCAFSGCHNTPTDDNDEIVLTTYSQIINTGEIDPYDANDSELYEVITEDDADKRMPPPPYAPLSATQIALLEQWIEQGAPNNSCDDTPSGCPTNGVTFSGVVRPILQNHCTGCHSGSQASGNINLTQYNQVSALALNGLLAGVINHSEGYVPMPFNQPALSACKIDQIEAWIAAGAPNN